MLTKFYMQSKDGIKDQMFSKIEQWQQSGLSQKAWCEHENIAYHIFHYWYKKFRAANYAAAPSPFVELKLQPSAMACAELLLPDGRRLIFHQPVGSDFLKAIIS